MTPTSVLLIANPQSRNGADILDLATARLGSAGIEVYPRESQSAEHVASLIEEFRNRVEMLVLAGGDGTLHAALGPLVEHSLTLALIPAGTANDFARNLNLPLDPEKALDAILHGRTLDIDLGSANDIFFCNAAHMGLGVRVTEELSADNKQSFGVLGYLRALKEALPNSRAFRVQIEANENRYLRRAIQITVGNGRFYGGGNVVSEDAHLINQRLHLFGVEEDSFWRLLLRLPLLRFGKHRLSRKMFQLDSQQFMVSTRGRRTIAVHADGEPTTETPVLFRVHPGALRVVVPRDTIVGADLDRRTARNATID